jgi:predicted DNA-binding transcriptional regulator AlpA
MSRRAPASTTPVLTISKAKLAAAMDVSESSIDELVRRGVLPKPLKLTPALIRWSWDAVERALASLAGTTDDGSSDPFMQGARNATQKASSEGGREPS